MVAYDDGGSEAGAVCLEDGGSEDGGLWDCEQFDNAIRVYIIWQIPVGFEPGLYLEMKG